MATIRKLTKKNGKDTYHVEIRIKGYDPMRATFDRITDAKIWANKYESDMKLGKKIKKAECTKHTLTELIDRYIEYELPQRKSDQKKFKMQLEWWKDKIGNYLLSDITPSLLSKYKDILANEPSKKPQKGRKTRSGATVNRYMACLSIVLTKAVKEWEWLDENPMFKVSKKKESKGRVRYLSEDEKTKLLSEFRKISQELYIVVLIAISTGARYSEIVNLRWKDIDFKNYQFHFLDTKNGEARGVPIANIVMNKLEEYSKIRNIKSDYIFANKDGKIIYFRNLFYKALEAAGIDNFHFHDLRHTAASYLAMNGASLLDIAEILGHKTLQMVQRYSHLTKKHTSTLMNKVAEKELENINKSL
ncbi:MAG: site-specific integrase [Muribaculaceae bacterium]|nr:site-specific integrase [Muribaculaceae bacterium]